MCPIPCGCYYMLNEVKCICMCMFCNCFKPSNGPARSKEGQPDPRNPVGWWVKEKELNVCLHSVFSTVQSVRLRGRTGRTTAHSRSFWGVLGRTTPREVRTGRTIGDYSPGSWTSCTSQVDHRPPNEFFSHHETSLLHSVPNGPGRRPG